MVVFGYPDLDIKAAFRVPGNEWDTVEHWY